MSDRFDLMIIGAGINGAGVARDAAIRGLKVLLLDKGDIGGGTSSWSTRLIHGGLRYLEHGEFGLVRESLRERETLLRIAPHLVKPLPMLIPLYRGARRSKLIVRVGMIAYDLLSSGKSIPSHKMLSVEETLQRAPGLQREGLAGAALYYDAQAEFPERLVLENVLSAVERGAELRTYSEVKKFVVEDGNINRVEIESSPTSQVQGPTSAVEPYHCLGHARSNSGRWTLDIGPGTFVINAAGPWVDHVLTETGQPSSRLMGGTKGSHIVVGKLNGAPETALYVEAQTDGRPFFIIPWNGKYLIGTTDIRYDGDLDCVQIDGDEIDYLLRETNKVLPNAGLTRDAILYTYSGVRPLPFTTTKNEQRITRRHFIQQHPRIENLVSLVGGKLTTYRSLAEETVDLVFERRGRAARECLTAKELLPGAHLSLSDTRLVRVYGSRIVLINELIEKDPSLSEVFDPETGATAAEIVFAFKYEFAATLADCLLRRTMVGLNSSHGLNAVKAAGEIARKHLGWPPERIELEVEMYREFVRAD
jgi:glycerol-3-phosphate dehydrogenase